MSQIVFLNSKSEVKPTAKGSYTMLTVNYRDANGRVASRNILSFAAKEVFNAFQNAKSNEVFEVTEDTNAKGYKEFTSAKSTGSFDPTANGQTGSTGSGTSASVAPKSNYETAEERANRQVLIVRQSSLSNAIALAAQDKKPQTVSEIITVASQFEDYVFGRGSAAKVAQAGNAIRSQRDASVDSDVNDDIVF